MPERLLVAVAVAGAVTLAAFLWFAGRRRLEADPGTMPPLPSRLLDGSERTWVVFTSPYCSTCGPVIERLRAADPAARVVDVDASRDRELADAFSVRTSPTVLLADASGHVQRRLVGAAAVEAATDLRTSATHP
jgi:glutaredoxin